MKRTFYILIFIALTFFSCKKEEKPTSVSIKTEKITPGTTTVLFEVTYEYPSILSEIKIQLASNANMSNAIAHNTIVNEKQFNATIENLKGNTTYYYLYEFKSGSTSQKSEVKFFKTNDYGFPIVTTNLITEVGNKSAICGGCVTDAGEGTVSARGVCWATSQNPTINNDKTVDSCGMGSFISNITGLNAATTYYVKAYATNEKGTAYGEQRSVTTLSGLPTVSTNSVANITAHSATCGGNVTYDGEFSITARGVCWSTSQNPTINNAKTVDGSGIGSFTSNITELNSSTTYYVRAYATNENGTAYGNQVNFTTGISNGTWTKKADLTGSARGYAVGFSISNKGYLGLGSGVSATLKDFWEYDPATNSWTQKANFAGGERSSAVGFSISNKGYIVTGNANNDFWEYDPVANSWTAKADFLGEPRNCAVGFSLNNKGYVGTGNRIGGSANYLNDFWEYNPATNQWTQKASFSGDARNSAIGFSINNKGYLGTGWAYSGTKQDFWEYDPATNKWTQKANFSGGTRYRAVGFSIGNKGYVGTGTNPNSFNDFWEYEPITNQWTKKADFTGGDRYEAVGFSIGNKGYLGTGYIEWEPTGAQKDFWEFTP